jgi:hypothetical protein
MRRVAVIAAALVLTSGPLFAQGNNDAGGKPDMQEMMKKWQEAKTPGAPHKALAELAGDWTVETKYWMAGPGSETSLTTGTSTMKMILGGLFLQQELTSEVMGMPMHGIGLTGYDNTKKKYVAYWIDNTSSAQFTMEGEMEKDGKTCTYWGVMDEPMTGERNKKVKYTLTMVDKDRHIFRIFDPPAYGEKEPVVEMVYSRKK